MEEEKLHDIFQDMMTSVIKEMPKDPIQFLIDRMTNQTPLRICVVTPPGMKGGEDTSNDLEEQGDNVALMLEQHLKIAEEQGQEGVGPAIQCISVGDLIQKEITKKSDFGKRIYESRKKYSYIEDEIVIELVKQHIDLCEKDRQNYKGWILEGFPRTRLQAIAL